MYYELSHSIDWKKVGMLPQSNRLTGKTTGGLSEAIHTKLSEIKRSADFPPSFPELNEILLDESAKVTDYLHTTYLNTDFGIIISDRFQKTLKDIKLTNYRYYEALATHKRREYPYHLLFLKSCESNIDFSASEFKVVKALGQRFVETKKFENADELLSFAKTVAMELKLVKPSKIKLTKELDMIKTPHSITIYISQKVKQIIDENHFQAWK